MKRILSLLAASLLSTAVLAAPSQAQSFSAEQTEAIEQIVHEYLVANPKVLLEMDSALRKLMVEEQANQAKAGIEKNIDALINASSTPSTGNPDGNIVVVEFFDYQCSHCKAMADDVRDLVAGDQDIKMVYKEFPIFGATSLYAAKAALAANRQGKFAEMHQALMETEGKLSEEKVLEVAKQVGLNINKLKQAIDDPAMEAEFKNNLKLARAVGIEVTPVFIIYNRDTKGIEFLPGAVGLDYLQDVITKIRNGENVEQGEADAS